MASVSAPPCRACCTRSHSAARVATSSVPRSTRIKRLAVAMRQVLRQRGSRRNGQPAGVDHDHTGVGVAHVPFGALRRIGERGLLKRRIAGQHTRRLRKILGPAALRAPAAIIDAALDRDVEHGPIDPALTSGNKFHGQIRLWCGISGIGSAALSSATFWAYIPWCRRKPAMAINGRRNKPFGPGGSTRRLHQFQESGLQ